jgi:hypothetical protein
MTTPHDGMTLQEYQAARSALASALAKFDSVSPVCVRCVHFQLGECKKFGAAPPAEFQETPGACDSWTYDGIPL